MYFKVCETKIDNFTLNYTVEPLHIVTSGSEEHGHFQGCNFFFCQKMLINFKHVLIKRYQVLQ